MNSVDGTRVLQKGKYTKGKIFTEKYYIPIDEKYAAGHKIENTLAPVRWFYKNENAVTTSAA